MSPTKFWSENLKNTINEILLDKWISSYVFVFFSGRNIVREADNGGIDHEKIRKDFQSHLFPEVEILEEEGFTIDPI